MEYENLDLLCMKYSIVGHTRDQCLLSQQGKQDHRQVYGPGPSYSPSQTVITQQMDGNIVDFRDR